MIILASYNIKGGVGKTATAVNLAYLAAQEGARTLIWDLDPQGAATFYFRIRARVKGGSHGLVGGKREVDEYVKGTDFPNLYLLPADFSYRYMDIDLESLSSPLKRLQKLLKPLSPSYDYIFLDCAPGISLVSEAVFRAAQILLVPIIPTTLSLRTLGQLLDFSRKNELDNMLILPFFSMVDRRKRLHREIVSNLTREIPSTLFTQIPYASEIEQMGLRREPLPLYAGSSRPAHCYVSLWSEIKHRIGRARTEGVWRFV